MLDRGGDQVHADQSDRGGAADGEAAGQEPEVWDPQPVGQSLHGQFERVGRQSVLRRRQNWLRLAPSAVGLQPDLPRIVAHEDAHDNRDSDGDASYEQHRGSPPGELDDRGLQGQEHQLAGRGAGGE